MCKTHYFLVVILLVFISGSCDLQAQLKRTIVPPETCYIDGNASQYKQLKGGDTLFFEGGSKQYLQIKNFSGTIKRPIIFVNINGMVTFNTDFYYGIKVANCRYIRLTGTGDPKYFYGFMIQKVAGGAGLSVGELSSDVEIDHIYISNTPIAGIYDKTDPDCSHTSERGRFTQYNTVIHDNYIGDVGNEGMYIGSSFYSGETVNCNGKDVVIYPSILEGVRIYNNIVKSTGWDGIQVGSAPKNCMIFNNLVMFDSQAAVDYQMSGILIGGGSSCDCYNNYIYKGKGDGIESLGLGNYRIFNNVIVDAGQAYFPSDPTRMKHGIYVNDNSCETGKTFSILFNDIINPKTNGIKFASIRSRKNLIASNVIISPGAGSNGYINLSSPSCDVLLKNNYTAMAAPRPGSADNTYALLKNPVVIDAGNKDNRNITIDFYSHPRPVRTSFDMGVNESNPKYLPLKTIQQDLKKMSDTALFPGKKNSLKIENQPFPNPASAKVSMTYSIDRASDVFLDVYNSGGIQIYHLKIAGMKPGSHSIDIDAKSYPEGVCLFTLRAGREAISGKFLKVK